MMYRERTLRKKRKDKGEKRQKQEGAEKEEGKEENNKKSRRWTRGKKEGSHPFPREDEPDRWT